MEKAALNVRRALARVPVVPVAVAGYLLLIVIAGYYFRMSLTPDRVVILLLILGLTTGRVRIFLRDWSLFLVVLLAWQLASGFSRHISNFRPHVTEMIRFDRFLFFGHLPTTWLQSHFLHAEHLAWYDVAAAVLYLLHFVFPISFAFALWQWRQPLFYSYMKAFVVLAMLGFATYVLFPAAPPWIAANRLHEFPHVHRIVALVVEQYLGGRQTFSTLYQFLFHHGGWDLYGAVPSEHAAFPFLCFLYARRAWPKYGWLLGGYVLAVSIAVVYLGEHYVADVLAGYAYAAVAYVVVQRIGMRADREAPAEIEPAGESIAI